MLKPKPVFYRPVPLLLIIILKVQSRLRMSVFGIQVVSIHCFIFKAFVTLQIIRLNTGLSKCYFDKTQCYKDSVATLLCRV